MLSCSAFFPMDFRGKERQLAVYVNDCCLRLRFGQTYPNSPLQSSQTLFCLLVFVVLCFFFFSAGSGHMVRNKLCWDANDAARLSKQRSSYQSSPTFLCFGSPTTLFASQHNLFRTMRPDHTKGLLLILLVSTKIKPNTLSGRATVGLHLSRKL